MCGIVGILNFEKTKAVQKKVLSIMTNSIAHRGPDDSGTIILKNAGLGSRRLAIIDLSEKGHMPMPDEKKELWITFNGEIYNYMEIREELLGKNYKFISNTDTEVILKSYREWGQDCLKKFDGMFAFAIYDTKKNELFIARDRLGVKPLYYAKTNNVFLFGSEIKAILKYPGFKRGINLKAVSSYLSYRYELGEETLFKNIYKLLPGHYMLVKDSKMGINQYWDIDMSKQKSKSLSYYKKEIKKMLEKSVRQRMISDVPLGAFLSGGLDSSVIVALMAKQSSKRVKTFSIGFKEEEFNEFDYSRQVAKMYNTEHKEILISLEDYMKTMKLLIKFKDLPLGVPNEVPLYLMSKELKKDITVVLSGEGADEIFSGYGRIYRSPLDYKKLKMMKYLPDFIKKSLFRQFALKYGNRQFNSEIEHFLFNYSYFPLEEKKFIFNNNMNRIIKNDEFLKKIFEEHFEKAKDKSYYEKIWYVFEKLHLPGLLQRVDCTTMAASVEARVPFVDDHNLVQFMFTVPSKYKMKWKSFIDIVLSFNETSDIISEKRDTTKYILRETFKNLLPNEIVKRKKKGFPVPLDSWFREKITGMAKTELLNKNSKIRVFVNQKSLEKWIESSLKKQDPSFGQKLWMLLNLEYWLREYFD